MSFKKSNKTRIKLIDSKEKVDNLLYQLSKWYKKLGGRKARCQIILIGGASILCSYHFRNITEDIDVFGDFLKEAVNKVTDENNLPNDWFNKDFMNTDSYKIGLIEFAEYYKTFNQVLEVRVIKGAALIAMKLNASRLYKNDISDIAGILKEEKEKGNEITLDEIKRVYSKLYGSYEKLNIKSRLFIESLMTSKTFDEKYYELIREYEDDNWAILREAIENKKDISKAKEKFKSLNELIKEIKDNKQ